MDKLFKMNRHNLIWLMIIGLFTVCHPLQTAAQAPWAKTGGGLFDDKTTDLLPTLDDGYIMSIYGSDTGGTGFTVVKIDQNGQVVWYGEREFNDYEDVPNNISINSTQSKILLTGQVDGDKHVWAVEFDAITGNYIASAESWSNSTAGQTGLSANGFYDASDSIVIFAADGNTLYRYSMQDVNNIGNTFTFSFPDGALNAQYAISASASIKDSIQIISGSTAIDQRPYIWAFKGSNTDYYTTLSLDSVRVTGIDAQEDQYIQICGHTFDSSAVFVVLLDTIGGIYHMHTDTIYNPVGGKVIGGDITRLSSGNYIMTAIKYPGTDTSNTIHYTLDPAGNIIDEIQLLVAEDGVVLDNIITSDGSYPFVYAGQIYTPTTSENEYCLRFSPTYPYLPACALDCVWPGDADNNGVVDMRDIFPLGVAYASTAYSRDSISTMWFGHAATAWLTEVYPGLDAKFGDCRGDGTITAEDTTGITNNYTLTHVLNYYKTSDDGIPIWLNTAGITLSPGYNEIPIMLGTELLIIDAIYGLEFNVSYEGPAVIDSTSLKVSFIDSWFNLDTSLITLNYKFPPNRSVDAGAVNTDFINRGGYGQIAKLGFIVEDNIAGILVEHGDSSIIFNINSASGIKYNYEDVLLAGSTHEIPVKTSISSVSPEAQKVFPNPWFTGPLTIVHPENNFTNFEVFNLQGEKIKSGAIVNQQIPEIYLQQLTNGSYFIKLINNNTIAFSQLIIFTK